MHLLELEKDVTKEISYLNKKRSSLQEGDSYNEQLSNGAHVAARGN